MTTLHLGFILSISLITILNHSHMKLLVVSRMYQMDKHEKYFMGRKNNGIKNKASWYN